VSVVGAGRPSPCYRWIFARDLTRMDGATTKTDWERSSQAFDLGLNLGLSVWFF